MFCVVYGGSGSGKSEFAEKLTTEIKKRYSAENMYYIATMKPYGDEGKRRVRRHREQRSGKGFITKEKYSDLKSTDIAENSVVLLECMSNLAANEMFDCGNKNAKNDIICGVEVLRKKAVAVVIVTNDIFSGGINYSSEVIKYMKLLADINIVLAEKADVVFEVVCGNAVRIKG